MQKIIDDNSLLLIDDFDFGIAVLDPELNILTLNKTAKKMFPQINKNNSLQCYKLFHTPPRDDFCTECPVKKAIKSGEIYETIMLLNINGKDTFFRLKDIPLKDEKGKIIKIIKIFEDISGIKNAEDKLNKEIFRNTIFAELSTALIKTKSIDEISQLVLEYAKKTTKSTYGYIGYINPSMDNLISSTLSDESETESSLNDIKKQAIKKDYLSIPVALDHKLMGQIVLANPNESYTDENIDIIKKFADIYAIAVNRKISEDALKLSEVYKYAILNAIPDMLFRIKKDGTYIDFFPGNTIEPTIPEEKFIGEKVVDILPEYISKTIMHLINKAIDTDQLQSWEYWLTDPFPDGEIHFFEARIVKYKNDEVLEIIRDISSRKKAEIALKESERRTRALINTPIDNVILLDNKGNILDVNSTVCEAFKKDRDDLINKNFFKLSPENVSAKRQKMFERALKLKKPVRYEDESNGIWRDAIINPILNDKKNVESVAVFARDITQIKENEHKYKNLLEELQKTSVSMKYFENVINSMTEAIFVTNLNGIIETTNNASSKMLGHAKESIIGNKLCKYFNNNKEADKICSELFKKGNVYNKELFFKKKDDTKINVLFSGSSMYDENNYLIGSVCVAKDITELKRAQDEIEISNRRFKQIAENINEVFWLTDVNRNNIYYVSPQVEVITGISVDELYGEPNKWIRSIHREDKERVLKEFKNFSANDLEIDYRIIKNGETRWLKERAFKIKTLDENIENLIITSIDITDYKKAQEEAETNRQRLLQADKLTSLGELSAGIAHEITQPLTGITMGLNNIIYDLAEENIDKSYLKIRCNDLLSYTERINKIIQHIRIFSREQKSTFYEYFDINESVNNALSLISNQYKNHNIKINLNLSDNLKPIKGNIFKLEQVILNLLGNAKYAVTKKSEIIKSKSYKKEISLNTYPLENKIFLEIKDNGIGISEENQKKVFDPFFTTKSAEDGTGLGMSITYSIIKEMNGEVTIKSKKDNFTIVYISFLI